MRSRSIELWSSLYARSRMEISVSTNISVFDFTDISDISVNIFT